MSKILNILKPSQISVSDSSNKNTSTSMTNTEVGICPKCSKSMSSALIANGDDVFYCESCRVAVPKPNKQ